MPITTKHTTVYVASDGSEHPTLEAAQAAEREAQLYRMLLDDKTVYSSAAEFTARTIVSRWTAIKAIMEGPVAADETVLSRDEEWPLSTQLCTCAARLASRYDEATGCWHCDECGKIVTGDSPASVAERAKSDWGGANVAPRRKRMLCAFCGQPDHLQADCPRRPTL